MSKRGNGANCVTAGASDVSDFLLRAQQRAAVAKVAVASPAATPKKPVGGPGNMLPPAPKSVATPQQKPAPKVAASPASAKSSLAYI